MKQIIDLKSMNVKKCVKNITDTDSEDEVSTTTIYTAVLEQGDTTITIKRKDKALRINAGDGMFSVQIGVYETQETLPMPDDVVDEGAKVPEVPDGAKVPKAPKGAKAEKKKKI